MIGILSIQPDNPNLRMLEQDEVKQFWCRRTSTAIQRLQTSHSAQFLAMLSWLQQHKALPADLWSLKLSSKYLFYYPNPTPLSLKQ